MSLNKKQARFTYKMAQLIVWAKEEMGIDVFGEELWRTPEMAEIYAERGTGIKNSVHRKKLALDIKILRDGKLIWDGDEYRILGEKWESMDEDARWGGRMRRRDIYHYSFIHNGVY